MNNDRLFRSTQEMLTAHFINFWSKYTNELKEIKTKYSVVKKQQVFKEKN